MGRGGGGSTTGARRPEGAGLADVVPALHPDPGKCRRPGGDELPAAHRPVAQGHDRFPEDPAEGRAPADGPARSLPDHPSADARAHRRLRAGGGAVALRQHAGHAAEPQHAPPHGGQADGLRHARHRAGALRRGRPLGAGALCPRHRLVPQGRAGLGPARHRRADQGISQRSLLPRGARPDAVRQRPLRRGGDLVPQGRPAPAELGADQDRLRPRAARHQQHRQRPRGGAQPRACLAAGVRQLRPVAHDGRGLFQAEQSRHDLAGARRDGGTARQQVRGGNPCRRRHAAAAGRHAGLAARPGPQGLHQHAATPQ